MSRVSSPVHNPFSSASAADGAEPYVSPPSHRGMHYSVPEGYRHHFESSWRAPSRPVLLVLLCVAGALFYLRSDRLLPVLMGTTTTRVLVADRAASAGSMAKPVEAFPIDFPANLPATAAGPISNTGSTVVKCVQADGAVVYQQQRECGSSAAAIRVVHGSR